MKIPPDRVEHTAQAAPLLLEVRDPPRRTRGVPSTVYGLCSALGGKKYVSPTLGDTVGAVVLSQSASSSQHNLAWTLALAGMNPQVGAHMADEKLVWIDWQTYDQLPLYLDILDLSGAML